MGKTKQRKRHRRFNWQIFLMAMAGVVFLLIFSYIPMFGIAIAFKDLDYSMNIMKDLAAKPWVGMQNFVKFVTDPQFGSVMSNTLILSISELVITFPIPIIFALLLNELRSSKFRKVVQTITYFPHFISWVVYASIVLMFVSSDGGFINSMLMTLGVVDQPISFLSQPDYFYPIVIISSIIKGTGWGSVVYVSAIAGVDQEIYEAVHIDGAGRFKTAIHITIPCIMPTVMVLLLLSISGILGSGFDRIYILQNPLNLVRSEVLDTYIYKVGIASRRYSYTTAVGLFKSAVAVILLGVSNFIAKKKTGNGIF